MSTRLNIQGGSQGEPTREFKTNFFHPQVKTVGLSNKTSHRFRILPAFDRNQFRPEDAGFKSSFVAYRDKNLLPDADKTEGFTDWYFVFSAHNWLGKSKQSFISPLTLNPTQRIGSDPLLDIYMFCKRHTDPRIKALIDKPAGEKFAGAVVNGPKSIMFFNGFVETSANVWENTAVYATNSALADLKAKLALRAGRNDKIISPDWPDYIYGDVTHPTQGLMAQSRKTKVATGNSSIETACIFFSNRDGVLDGANAAPLDPNTPQGLNALLGRYDLLDGNVTKVASYEEILDYIVTDGTIPYAIIHEACQAHVARVPAQPASAQVANAGMPPEDDNIPFGAAPQIRPPASAPAPFAPAPAPAAPAPAPFAPTPPAFAAAPAAPAASPFGTAAAPFPGVAAAPGNLPPPPGGTPFGTEARVTPALSQPGAAPASDADRARFDQLTQKLIAGGGKALTDAEMREMGELSARVNVR